MDQTGKQVAMRSWAAGSVWPSRRTVSVFLKILVTAALIGLFLREMDAAAVADAATRARLAFLGGAVALFAISNFLGALQWARLLQVQGLHLPLQRVVTLYFVGVFFNNFLVGNVGGDAVRVSALSRATGKTARSLVATGVDRIVGLTVILLLAVVAFLLTPELWIAGLALPMAGAAVGIATVVVLWMGSFRRLSDSATRLLARWSPARLSNAICRFAESLRAYRRARTAMMSVLAIAVAVQLARIGAFFVVGRGLGVTVAFEHYVVVIPLIAIVAALPISFGGLGVREGLGALLFAKVGATPEDALTMLFLGYLSGVTASSIGGLAFALRCPEIGRKPVRVERGEPASARSSLEVHDLYHVPKPSIGSSVER